VPEALTAGLCAGAYRIGAGDAPAWRRCLTFLSLPTPGRGGSPRAYGRFALLIGLVLALFVGPDGCISAGNKAPPVWPVHDPTTPTAT